MQFFDDLRKLQSRYCALLEPICRQYSLTRNELDILLFLHNNPLYDRAADIVAYRGIAKSHVSESVASLEARGWLRREIDGSDRRIIRLLPTDNASPAIDAGKLAQQSFSQLLTADLSAQERELLRHLLEKIQNTVKNMEE